MERRPDPSRKHLLLAGLALLLAAGAGLVLLTARQRRGVSRQGEVLARKQNQGPLVHVARVTRPKPVRALVLTGESRPYLAATLFARVSGYLKEVRVDKGDRVREGQTLAVIESPETDRAYLAALADARNKQRIAERARVLRRRRLISQQEEDQAVSASQIADANLETQVVQRSYETLQAPFDGTIVARYLDPGALVQNASASQASSPAFFDIAQTDRLRIYGYVEQKDAVSVRPGIPAELRLSDEENSPTFRANVTRTAGALDPKTRTLLIEIDMDNPRGEIIAGSFLTITLQLPNPAGLEVPVKALVVRGGLKSVPVVGPDQKLHFQPVVTGGTDGSSTQILEGLEEGQEVALDASIYVEGQKVRVEGAQSAGQAGEPGDRR